MMNKTNPVSLFPWLLILALASVAPNAFPAAQAGYGSLYDLALMWILPAALSIAAIAAASQWKGTGRAARTILAGASAGAIATFALEAVRYPGFKLGFMPGNLPELMGVLVLDTFAEGPSLASTVAGYAYHFWIGASFGIIFAVLGELGIVRLKASWSSAYGILLGLGFLASPVVDSLGGGFMGREFGWTFWATVLSAHAAFGVTLGALLAIVAARLNTPFRTGNPHLAAGGLGVPQGTPNRQEGLS